MTKKLLVIVIEDEVSMADSYRTMINLVPYAEAEVIHDGADGLLTNNNEVISCDNQLHPKICYGKHTCNNNEEYSEKEGQVF